MKLAEKQIKYYLHVVMVPTIVLVGWSLVGLVIAFFSYSTYRSIFSSTATLVLALAAYGFIGWTTIKDHKGKIEHGQEPYRD